MMSWPGRAVATTVAPRRAKGRQIGHLTGVDGGGHAHDDGGGTRELAGVSGQPERRGGVQGDIQTLTVRRDEVSAARGDGP